MSAYLMFTRTKTRRQGGADYIIDGGTMPTT